MIKPISKKKKKSSPPKEKVIQANMLAWLRVMGVSCDIITLGAYSTGGISDIIGCMPDGRFLSVEVKRPKGKVTKLQEMWIVEKLKSNGISVVAHSVDELAELLRGYGYEF